MAVANVIKEVSTSKLIKQLENVKDKFVGNGADKGSGHADVWFMPINISPQVFNPEHLKGSLIC